MNEIEEAKHSLSIAAKDALSTISEAAKEATKVIALAASAASAVKTKNTFEDHDAITTLVANFQNLKESQESFHCEVKQSFKDLKENYTEKIADNQKSISGHDVRILSLEESRAELKGKASMASVIIAYIATAVSIIVTIIMYLKK